MPSLIALLRRLFRRVEEEQYWRLILQLVPPRHSGLFLDSIVIVVA